MKKNKKLPIFLTIGLGIYAMISLYPLIYLLFYSLKTTDEIFYTNPFGVPLHPQFENYSRAFQSFNIVKFFGNSIIVTAFSVIGILVLALPFAYAVSRMHWKLKKAVSTYITLGLFIPVQKIK